MLDRIQGAIDREKTVSFHLSRVSDDIRNIRTVLQRLKENASLQSEAVQDSVQQILNAATPLDTLVQDQAAKCSTGGGFRRFAHHYASGPAEQKKLQEYRAHLQDAKSTLNLAIAVDLSRSGTSRTIRGNEVTDCANMNNAAVGDGTDNLDAVKPEVDHLTIEGNKASGFGRMNNANISRRQDAIEFQRTNDMYSKKLEHDAMLAATGTQSSPSMGSRLT